MTGALQFRGTVDRPDLNGGLGFRNGKADVVMLGTTFGLDTTRLIVDNGKILFRQYRFIAPNKSDMVLNGAITLTPFDRMNMSNELLGYRFDLAVFVLFILVITVILLVLGKNIYVKKKYGNINEGTIKNDMMRVVSVVVIIIGFVLGALLAWKILILKGL